MVPLCGLNSTTSILQKSPGFPGTDNVDLTMEPPQGF